MADRNPFIPSERRQDVEGQGQAVKEEATQLYTEKQAKLDKEADLIAQRQAEDAERVQQKPSEES